MRTLSVFTCCLAVGSLAFIAAAKPPAGGGTGAAPPPPPRAPAQGGGGAGPQARQGLSPEKAKAAWELEATGVAKHLGATEEQTKAVVKAYADARASQADASDKLRKELADKARTAGGGNDGGGGGGGGGRGGLGPEGQKALEELAIKEREKLQKALGATLSADQTTKAMASFGTFNRQWDIMVDAIAGFKLDAPKQQDALVAIEEFVIAQAKARSAAGDGGDRDAMRTAMQESRDKLTDSLKKSLTEAQLKTFEESTRGGRGQGQGGRGGPGGGGGGGG